MAVRTLYADVQRIGRWTYRYRVLDPGPLGATTTCEEGQRLGRARTTRAARRALARHIAKRERDATYLADRTVLDS